MSREELARAIEAMPIPLIFNRYERRMWELGRDDSARLVRTFKGPPRRNNSTAERVPLLTPFSSKKGCRS